MGNKAKNVFVRCEYYVNYPLAVASGIDEIVKDYDQKIFEVDAL